VKGIHTPPSLWSPQPHGEELYPQLEVFEIEGLHQLLNPKSACKQVKNKIRTNRVSL